MIKHLKTEISYGYDEISTRILKISSPSICSPLYHILNEFYH